MATPDSDLPDRYNLVSSLYGPGTTACWYLTALSCLVSWTLHPKKRKSGSLDSDFIAVLTFPAVAAGHLISQIHDYPDNKAELLTTNDPDLLLRIAAIEAPLNITETSMPTFVLMFILAVYFRCIKRAIYIALVGLFCAAAESYMFFVTWSVGNSQQNLSRPFLVNFAWISIGILALLFTLLTFTLGLLLMFCFKRRPHPFRPSTLAECAALREYQRRHPDPYEDIHLQIISSVAFLVLPFGMIGSLSPLLVHTLANSSDRFSSWICKAAIRLVQGLFPRTNVSIMDIDQAVAVLAGATVLGFGLYGAANAHYQKWLERVMAREEHRAIEMRNLPGSVDERHEEHQD